MKNLLNPKWLLLINTLPVIVLFFMFYGQFSIIESLLEKQSISLWKQFGGLLFTIAILQTSYTAYLIYAKKEIEIIYPIFALPIYIVFLYFYGLNSEYILPSSIPRWMISGEFFLYVGMFIMPTLIHCLIVLVIKLTSLEKPQNPIFSFLFAIAIPITWYLVLQIMQPLYKLVDSDFGRHVAIVLMISGIIGFLFFLIRTIYIIALKNSSGWTKYQLVWKIPFVLIFPILGLMVNSGQFFDLSVLHAGGFFGNFSSPWFYILTIINAVLLCIPKQKKNNLRLVLFGLKSITFSYTIYFFLVFLPFLPFSVVALIMAGAGFLMLAPLVLFVIHTKDLGDDFSYLKNSYSNKKITLILITGFLCIPFCLTMYNCYHKSVLNQTLDYVYNPDYQKEYNINKSSIINTLDAIKSQKNNNWNDIFSGTTTPILSSYFNWIVLDNLTLSNEKLSKIETIFKDSTDVYIYKNENQDFANSAKLINYKVNSKYDNQQKHWISWVDLQIKNSSTESRLATYQTQFHLPSGAYISDYYLYVGNKKEKGLLAEKKAAQWVFNQIQSENRDPGILYYEKDNNITFKIFPFDKNEIRKTGIEFIHKDAIEIDIDGSKIKLGKPNELFDNQNIETKNAIYVSAEAKQKLTPIIRKPYYHFIVNSSETKIDNRKQTISKIESILKSNTIDSKNAKITFANTYSNTEDLGTNWKEKINSQTYEGGFFLDRAIKKVLFQSYTKVENQYPIIVVANDHVRDGLIENNFSEFKMAFPEHQYFYCIDSVGQLEAHSLIKNPEDKIEIKVNLKNEVLAYPNPENPTAFLINDGQPQVILKKPIFEFGNQKSEKNWSTGLRLEANNISQILYPAEAEKNWLKTIKQSFMSKILTPQTSYIVVESEAQKAMILKKQQEVLSGNKALDLEDETQNMSEPDLFILISFMILFFLYKKKRM